MKNYGFTWIYSEKRPCANTSGHLLYTQFYSTQKYMEHGLSGGYLLEQFLYYIWKFLQDVSTYDEGVQGQRILIFIKYYRNWWKKNFVNFSVLRNIWIMACLAISSWRAKEFWFSWNITEIGDNYTLSILQYSEIYG